MQVQIILEVMEYIRKMMEETNIVDAYSKFAVLAGTNQPTAESSALFEKETEKIIELQKKMEPRRWTYSKYRIFKEINKDNLLGESAVDELHALAELNKNAYYNLVEPLQYTASELAKLYSIVKQKNPIVEVRNSYLTEQEAEHPERNVIYIYYEGNISIKDLNGFSKFSRIWDQILLTLHEITGEASTDVSIASLDMYNSCLSFGVKAGETTIQALSFAVNSILEEYARIYKIRKVQLDVISLNLTKEIIGMLEDEVQSFIQSQSVAIVNAIFEKYASTKNSIENHEKLIIVIRQIIDFIEKGGRINFESPYLNPEQNHKLNENYDFVAQIKEVVVETGQYTQ